MTEKQEEIIASLFKRYYQRLYMYAVCRLEDRSLAEEAVQETFRIACQKPEALCGSASHEGWLILTLKYVIANTQRSREATKRLYMEYVSMNETERRGELLSVDLLYSNISDTEEFRLIKEFAVNGHTYREIAQSLGISYTACKQRFFRARETLKKKLEREEK